jgi:hypothetical protein
MAIDRPKGVNIFRDLFLLFATRREAQLIGVLIIVGLIAAFLASSAISRRIESARAKANAELEQKRQFDRIEKEQEQQRTRQKLELEEQEVRRKLEQEQYIRSLYRFPAKRSSHTAFALAVGSNEMAPSLRDEFAIGISGLLEEAPTKARILSDVVLPKFYSEGCFERAFSGDTIFLDETGFYEEADGLLLVRPRVRIAQSESVGGVRSCQLGLSLRLVSKDRDTRSLELSASGIGFSPEASLKKAFENLQPEQKRKIQTLLE